MGVLNRNRKLRKCIYVNYFLYFDNCDCRVKIEIFLLCFVLTNKKCQLQLEQVYMRKVNILSKQTFIWCVTLGTWQMVSQVSIRIGITSLVTAGFPFLFSLIDDSSNKYQYDSKAFLFSLVNKPEWAPVKLPQTGRHSSKRVYSVRFRSSYGPTFGGGHDIFISSSASSNSHSYSNLGHTYSAPSGYSYSSTFAQTFLAGTLYFTPDEVETFYESN